MRIRLALLVLITLGLAGIAGSKTAAVTAVASMVTPINGGMLGGAPIVINASPGNQTDPHVSGDLAAYSDEFTGQIRYYDFLTGMHGVIPTPAFSTDQLSNVSGHHISFVRQTGLSRALMVFDVWTSTTVQVGPDNSNAFSTALGGNTVAFTGFNDIFVGDISTPAAPLTNLSDSPDFDAIPAVSPNGHAVVWQTCASNFANCRVLKSLFNGFSWSSAVHVAADSLSPDTDGVTVAYDSFRAGAIGGSDIYFQPLDGGLETQLELDGAQQWARISDGIIVFDSTASWAGLSDLFLYQISTNTLYQITDTPTAREHLSDVTVLTDGRVRVVWAAHPNFSPDNDILTQTFTLPQPPPPPPVFQICPLYDPLVAKKTGSVYPIKLQLCDANGHNLSSSSIVLHATGVTQASTNAPGPLDDTGNANPDFDFRYDAALGGTGGYIFNLSLRGFPTGTYNLNFTVGATSASYSVGFAVK